MRQDTEHQCHCGAEYRGSDHCPECYCEQYESTCDHQSVGEPCAECGERFNHETTGRCPVCTATTDPRGEDWF